MHADKVEGKKGKRRVVNVVEIGDESVYIRLDDGKKYLLNGDGCWRCGSCARCFGNLVDSDELAIICEFDFFDEVNSLFLCLLQDRMSKLADWLCEKLQSRTCMLLDRLVNVFDRTVQLVNLKG